MGAWRGGWCGPGKGGGVERNGPGAEDGRTTTRQEGSEGFKTQDAGEHQLAVPLEGKRRGAERGTHLLHLDIVDTIEHKARVVLFECAGDGLEHGSGGVGVENEREEREK